MANALCFSHDLRLIAILSSQSTAEQKVAPAVSANAVMTPTPKRIIVVDPSLRDNVGHHIEYDLSLLHEAKQQGLGIVVLAHKDAVVMLPASENIIAAFSEDIWGTSSAGVDWDVRLKVLGHRILAGATIVFPLLAAAGWLSWKIRLHDRISRLRRRCAKLVIRALRSLAGTNFTVKVLDVLRDVRDNFRIVPGFPWVAFPALLNPRFYFELRKHLARLKFCEQDLVFCHMATYRHLLEWGMLASSVAKSAFPQIVLLLRYPPQFYASSTVYSGISFRLLERVYSEGKIRLATDSERLAREFARYTYVPFEILPIRLIFNWSEANLSLNASGGTDGKGV